MRYTIKHQIDVEPSDRDPITISAMSDDTVSLRQDRCTLYVGPREVRVLAEALARFADLLESDPRS